MFCCFLVWSCLIMFFHCLSFFVDRFLPKWSRCALCLSSTCSKHHDEQHGRQRGRWAAWARNGMPRKHRFRIGSNPWCRACIFQRIFGMLLFLQLGRWRWQLRYQSLPCSYWWVQFQEFSSAPLRNDCDVCPSPPPPLLLLPVLASSIYTRRSEWTDGVCWFWLCGGGGWCHSKSGFLWWHATGTILGEACVEPSENVWEAREWLFQPSPKIQKAECIALWHLWRQWKALIPSPQWDNRTLFQWWIVKAALLPLRHLEALWDIFWNLKICHEIS